jgi:hypothetical protein
VKVNILLSVLFAFFITFTLFYLIYIQTPNPDSKENIYKFFTKKFEDKNKILLIGSSYVGEMNSTYVHEKISKKYSDFAVYNLSYGGDNPNKRIQFIDEIIELDPVIVFYGISYRDLRVDDISEKKDLLPNIKQFFHSIKKDNIDPTPVNPKLITLQNIRNQFQNFNLFPNSEIFFLPYTPFMTFQSYHTIIDTDLHYSLDSKPFDTLKMKNFYNLIKELHENKISVVVFTPPHHKSFLENISISEQQDLRSLILNTTNNFELNFYNFTYKYQDLEIWRNPSHVAYHIDSLIYSRDVVSMINLEIEK